MLSPEKPLKTTLSTGIAVELVLVKDVPDPVGVPASVPTGAAGEAAGLDRRVLSVTPASELDVNVRAPTASSRVPIDNLGLSVVTLP